MFCSRPCLQDVVFDVEALVVIKEVSNVKEAPVYRSPLFWRIPRRQESNGKPSYSSRSLLEAQACFQGCSKLPAVQGKEVLHAFAVGALKTNLGQSLH